MPSFIRSFTLPRRSVLVPWSLLTIAMVTMLVHFYGRVFRSPNSMLFSGVGDGLKNYFTYVWHVDHDASFLHFGGAGYPHGDHVFFTDGHPLLAWMLQVLPFLAPYKIGILNLGLVLGFLICAWCLFAVLLRYRVAPWAAAIGAFSITVLQPQIFRMGGHLALAHCWFIPLTWYALMRTRDAGRWRLWTILTSVIVLVAFLIHPYMGFMNALFVLGYLCCAVVLRWRTYGRERRTYLAALIIGVLPMLVFMGLLQCSDVAPDRAETPNPTLEHATRVMSLIITLNPPFSSNLYEFFKYDNLNWETWCYIGFTSLIVLVIAGWQQVKRWVTPSTIEGASTDNLGLALGGGFLVLLFAMHIWQDLLGRWLPILEQFRATGRFAWVFYFTCTVFCTVRAYQYLFERGPVRRALAIPVFVMFIGFYAVEGWGQHEGFSASIGSTPNLFDVRHRSAGMTALTQTAQQADVSGIIPLPYMHIGSDHYQMDATDKVMGLVYPLAFHSGVPLMAGTIIRTPLQDTRDLVTLFAPLSFRKQLEHKLPADSRFLLLWSKEQLEEGEMALWSRGTPLFEDDTLALRVITAKELFACDAEERQEQFRTHRDRMIPLKGWLLSPAGEAPFDSLDLRNVLLPAGERIIAGTTKDYTTLAEWDRGELDTALTYELSFIYRAVRQGAVNATVIVESRPGENRGTMWEASANVRAMPMQVGERTVVRIGFRPSHVDHLYRILVKGPEVPDEPFEVDHVLIRPLAVDAWRVGAWDGTNTVFFNNIPLHPAIFPKPDKGGQGITSPHAPSWAH